MNKMTNIEIGNTYRLVQEVDGGNPFAKKPSPVFMEVDDIQSGYAKYHYVPVVNPHHISYSSMLVSSLEKIFEICDATEVYSE